MKTVAMRRKCRHPQRKMNTFFPFGSFTQGNEQNKSKGDKTCEQRNAMQLMLDGFLGQDPHGGQENMKS